MRRYIMFFISGVSLLGLGVFFYLRVSPPATVSCERTLRIREETICVEIAQTDAQRQQGLSGHAPLGEREGMLFIFPTASRHSFWMKEMTFPLDMIWIRSRVVIDLTEDVPPPADGASLSDLPTYAPDEDADMVLEVPAGTVRRLGIRIGDTIRAQ